MMTTRIVIECHISVWTTRNVFLTSLKSHYDEDDNENCFTNRYSNYTLTETVFEHHSNRMSMNTMTIVFLGITQITLRQQNDRTRIVFQAPLKSHYNGFPSMTQIALQRHERAINRFQSGTFK